MPNVPGFELLMSYIYLNNIRSREILICYYKGELEFNTWQWTAKFQTKNGFYRRLLPIYAAICPRCVAILSRDAGLWCNEQIVQRWVWQIDRYAVCTHGGPIVSPFPIHLLGTLACTFGHLPNRCTPDKSTPEIRLCWPLCAVHSWGTKVFVHSGIQL